MIRSWLEMSSEERRQWLAHWIRVTQAKTMAELEAAMKRHPTNRN